MGYMILSVTALLFLIYFPMVSASSSLCLPRAARHTAHAPALAPPPPSEQTPCLPLLAPPLLTWRPALLQWGGMIFPAKEGVTEEDYYLAEWSAEEKAAGLHTPSLKFAFESKSERGWGKQQAGQAPVDGKAARQ
jgi:hypothetical protein